MKTIQTIKINRIITTALKKSATDLHLSVGNNPIVRVDDTLEVLAEEEIITADFLNNLADSLFNDNEKKELQKKLEISIVHDYGNRVRFRINVFYQKNFLNFSFKFIPPIITSLKDLGLPKVIEDLVNLKKGLIIVGGGYDSGRTTTVFSLLEEINRTQKRYIVTIEKPMEFIMASNKSIVAQRNIPTDVKSYEDGLAYCENDDVDIIMIDNLEQSSAVLVKALELASASSKLVIGIISARGAISAIENIFSFFSGQDKERVRFLLSQALECILVQKLVPRVGGGRILVPEILIANEPVKKGINEDRIYQLKNILQTSRQEGMRGIDRALAELASTGEITLEQALEYADNKESLKIMMK